MIITAIILGIGLAMDAFAVSITNGLCAGRFKPRHALADGLTFGLFQAAMPLIGFFLGLSFMKYIEVIDHWIAFILLGGIGANMIRGALKKEEEDNISVNVEYTLEANYEHLADCKIEMSIRPREDGISLQ